MADPVEDQIIDRWCPVLRGGRRERAGWRFPCPCCGSPRELSVQAKGGRWPTWNNHCPCLRTEVRAKLVKLGLLSARARAIDRDDLIALALAVDLPPMTLRLRVLELAGVSTTEALDKLGVRRDNRARVIAGRNGAASRPTRNRRS